MKTRIVLIPITLLCVAIASVQSARAATITVTNTKDSGPGSLRQVLADANDGDTINFDSSLNGQKITLTSGELSVDKDVIISGPGASHLAVDGNAQSRVLSINPGNTVTISGLTIENGYTNEPPGGGGIFNYDGTLTVSDCTISGNSGGGISNDGFRGGATLTVTNCTVNDNTGTSSGGGGINNGGDEGGALLTITNSTISGNSAGFGGGIANGGGIDSTAIVTVSNSTLSGNSAEFGGGIGNGAAVSDISEVTVSNSTLSGNSATGNGGGIYNAQGGATLELSNTIVNAGSSGENIFNDGGTVSSHGYNLTSDDGGGYLTGPGDQINTDPALGPLQDNGGPTFTHALLLGSPAINAGDPSFTPPPFYDQRGLGFDRVVNGRIDIGSLEVQTQIHLQASGRKVGGINTVLLTWSGTTSANTDVYRNGALIVTTVNNGSYRDSTGDTGRARYTYRVCEAGTDTCSNNARVTFRQ